MSHGESFLTLVQTNLDSPGFYCLDEPEAALSFSSILVLVGALHDLAAAGSQVLCATHSPVLAALPERDDLLATVFRPLGWAFATWGTVLYGVAGVAYVLQVRHLRRPDRAAVTGR